MYWQIYIILKGQRAWLLRLIDTSREASVAQRARVRPGSALPGGTFPRAPRQLLPPSAVLPTLLRAGEWARGCPSPPAQGQTAGNSLFSTTEGSAHRGKNLPWDYRVKNKVCADPHQRKELAQTAARWDFKFHLGSSTILSEVTKKRKRKKMKTRKPKPAAKNALHEVSEWGSNRAQAGDSKTSEGQGGTLNFHFLLLPSASLWCKPTTDTHLLS